jgi:menaquinone-dependent protoporphyrinogen oxidase
MPEITRRKFLKIAGLVVGGSVFACGGGTALALQAPKIEFINESYGEGTMSNNKILVAYASKCGSTAEVAAKIGETIATKGFEVDVKPAREVTSLDGYQSVVLGSAIRMGQWLPDALNFARKFQTELSGLPVSIFCVHLLNSGDTQDEKAARVVYTTPIKKVVNPQKEAFFTGKTDLAKMSFFDRTLSKLLKAQNEDKRDWNAIQNWATELVSNA